MKWKPIITQEAHVNIVSDMLNQIDIRLNEVPCEIMNLHSGILSRSLYFFYRYKHTGNENFFNYAADDLNKGINYYITNKLPIDSLYYGTSGAFWMYNHFVKENAIDHDQRINDYFIKFIKETTNVLDHDLIHGFIGSAISVLEDASTNEAKELINDLIEAAYAKLTIKDELLGIVSYNQYSDSAEVPEDLGIYNLGMAHGLASVLSFLSLASTSNSGLKVLPKVFDDLLQTVIQADGKHTDFGYRFNSYYGNVSGKYISQRLGWCYCDLGISIALYNASIARSSNELHSYSYQIAKSTLEIKKAHFRINDYSLCHGFAGIAHLYGCLFNFYGDESFREASIIHTNEVSKNWDKIISDTNHGFLNGISGLGLALISSIDSTPPKWNRCLLLS